MDGRRSKAWYGVKLEKKKRMNFVDAENRSSHQSTFTQWGCARSNLIPGFLESNAGVLPPGLVFDLTRSGQNGRLGSHSFHSPFIDAERTESGGYHTCTPKDQ